jgi:hypothetical protein
MGLEMWPSANGFESIFWGRDRREENIMVSQSNSAEFKWTRSEETIQPLREWFYNNLKPKQRIYLSIFALCGIFGFYMGFFQMNAGFGESAAVSAGITALLFLLWFGGKFVLLKTSFLLPKNFEIRSSDNIVGIKVDSNVFYKLEFIKVIGRTKENRICEIKYSGFGSAIPIPDKIFEILIVNNPIFEKENQSWD